MRRVPNLLISLVVIILMLVPTASSVVGASPDRYSGEVSDSRENDVRAVIDKYFQLKYESHVRGIPLDISSVVDTSTPAGKALSDYEQARLEYFLRCWKLGNCSFTAYSYAPGYESFEFSPAGARVRMRPKACLSVAHGDQVQAGQEPHTIQLIHDGAGWRLVEDLYENEWTRSYPRGTDFVMLEATLEDRWALAQGKSTMFETMHSGDPGFLDRFGNRQNDMDIGALGYLDCAEKPG